jgi:bifunctional DNA-binding transcriptional regulator/antitoxin component of YhaV-PrlF toxin-antitoxin module
MTKYYHETRMAKTKSGYFETVRVGANRGFTLPSRIAKALRLKAGDPMLMRLVGRKLDLVPIPGDQLWFWTPEWQKKEREVDEDISQGRVKETASINELIRDLKS